jgi:hypothetical protein
MKGSRSELRLRKFCSPRYGVYFCLGWGAFLSSSPGSPLSIIQIVPSNYCFTPRMVTSPGGISIKRMGWNGAVVVRTLGHTRASWSKWRLHRLGISTLVSVNIVGGML